MKFVVFDFSYDVCSVSLMMSILVSPMFSCCFFVFCIYVWANVWARDSSQFCPLPMSPRLVLSYIHGFIPCPHRPAFLQNCQQEDASGKAGIT